MIEQTWTVARFPDGSWTCGGPPDSPDYAECEVWRVLAGSDKEAIKKAQQQRRNWSRREARRAAQDSERE